MAANELRVPRGDTGTGQGRLNERCSGISTTPVAGVPDLFGEHAIDRAPSARDCTSGVIGPLIQSGMNAPATRSPTFSRVTPSPAAGHHARAVREGHDACNLGAAGRPAAPEMLITSRKLRAHARDVDDDLPHPRDGRRAAQVSRPTRRSLRG